MNRQITIAIVPFKRIFSAAFGGSQNPAKVIKTITEKSKQELQHSN